jgi:hypothetical protein
VAEKAEQVDVVGSLASAIGEQMEKQRKKAEPIPEVYSSGMRGREKPPHLREKPKARQKSDEDKGEERFTKDGKRIVTFKAKPRANVSDQVAELQKQVADLTKKLGGKEKPAAAAKKKLVIA